MANETGNFSLGSFESCDTNATWENCSDYYDLGYSPTVSDTAIILTLLFLVLFVGVVGNVLVLTVIAAVPDMRTTVNRCLGALAIADLIILVFLPVYPVIVSFDDSQTPTSEHFCNFANLVDRGARICSVFIFIYVTADRYLALCYPMRSRRFWTGRKTYILLLVLWILSFALSYPFFYVGEYIVLPAGNSSYYFCYFPYSDYPWLDWYDAVTLMLVFYLPVPFLFFAYGRMVHTIRLSLKKGDKATPVAGRRSRRQVIVMLLLVLVIYTVTQLPFGTLLFIDSFFPDTFSLQPFDRRAFSLTWTGRVLFFINSASNPIIYFSLSTNFRHGFVATFCSRRRKSLVSQSTATKQTVMSVRSSVVESRQDD